MYKILVLEDNIEINNILSNTLKKLDYEVFSCFNGFDAMDVFSNEKIDVIITDLVLPIMSGERFIREVRKLSNVHILVISAKISLDEKLEGLRIGADDYLTKPFSPEEVVIKLCNYFKKKEHQNKILSLNDGEFIFEESKVDLIIYKNKISLTAIEYSILQYFSLRLNSVVTRTQLLNNIICDDKFVTERIVDTHIKNIRKKISAHTDTEFIKTIYGLGYSLTGSRDEA